MPKEGEVKERRGPASAEWGSPAWRGLRCLLGTARTRHQAVLVHFWADTDHSDIFKGSLSLHPSFGNSVSYL